MSYFNVAMIAFAAISASIGGYSAVAAGENAEETADFNAEMQKRTADDALQRGSIDAADKRQETRQMIARQHAAQAASGFDTTQGTAGLIMDETAGMGELDALKILNNAQRQASGLKASAELEMFKGNAASSAGKMNAAGSVISSASTVVGYYGMKQ